MVKTTSTSFQRNICRTCLRKITASDSIEIFSDKKFYNGQTLNQVFQEITQTLINSKEMLPVNICQKCAEKLKQTIAFKRSIEKADRILRCKLRLVEMRHSMKKIYSITSALDAICSELNEICDEYETSNEKPPEMLTVTTQSNTHQKQAGFDQVSAWQQNIESIADPQTSLTPKNNNIVKITNTTLNRVKQNTFGKLATSKVNKSVTNNKIGDKNSNTNQLKTNLENYNNQPVPVQIPELDEHANINVDPLMIPKISEVYSENSDNLKNKKTNSPEQNYSAIITDIIDSTIGNAIILIEDTVNSDVSNVYQVAQEEPTVVLISDDEEEINNTRKNSVGPQKVIHNVTKGNFNMRKENYNPGKNNSQIKNDSSLDKTCILCNTNREQCSFEEELSWMYNESHFLENPKGFTADSENLTCGKCGKKFTNAHFLQRHLLYHSLKLEPTDREEEQQKNHCTPSSINFASVYRNAEHMRCRSSFKKTNTDVQEEPAIGLSDHTYNLPRIPTHLQREQTLKSLCNRSITDAKAQQVIDRNYNCPAPSLQINSKTLNVIEEECKYCKKLFKHMELHRHIAREHKSLYKREVRKFCKMYYKCNQCPVGRIPIPERLIHMTTKHIARFMCTHCEKVFTGKRPLFRHLRQFHEDAIKTKKTSLCHICGKLVNYASSAMHMKSHTNTKSIKCTIKGCNAMLKYNTSLKHHLAIVHGNEKPFICERCGKQFAFRRNLTHHMGTHLDVLPFNCVICEKGFVLRGRLKRHLMSHQHNKPYSCPICPQTFGHKNSIKKHCIRYHPEHELAQNKPRHLTRNYSIVNSAKKTIECKLCQRKFAYEYTLKKHNRTFHPVEYFNLKRKQLNNDCTIEEIIDQEKNYFKNFLS